MLKKRSSEQPEKNVETEEEKKELEEEIQKVVNEYVDRIKKRMKENNISMKQLIQDKIEIGQTESQEFNVVRMQVLMEIIKNITGNEFNENELADVEEIFGQLGNHEIVIVDNLLDFFGEKAKKTIHLSELDEISLEILKRLSKYLQENKIKLADLFSQAIYKQVIKTKKKQKEVDVLASEDFFAILRAIEILPYEMNDDGDEHDNLRNFLCINLAQYSSILYVNKLQKAIECFEAEPQNENVEEVEEGDLKDDNEIISKSESEANRKESNNNYDEVDEDFEKESQDNSDRPKEEEDHKHNEVKKGMSLCNLIIYGRTTSN